MKKKTFDWEQDPYAQKWLENLGTDTTREGYRPIFDDWVAFIGMTPTEQIKRRIENLQSNDPTERGQFEDKVKDYVRTLVTRGYGQGTVHRYTTVVMSFFAHNRLHLKFSRGELSQLVKPTDRVIKKWTPNNNEVRAIYHFTDSARDRAILLMMYQSGLNEADICELNIEDLQGLTEDENYYIEKYRAKTDELTQTCVSLEAVHELRVYLRQRGSVQPKDPLFVTSKGNRIDNRTIAESFKAIVEKACPEKANLWQTKNLRSSYNDALLRAGIVQEVKDVMMGHKRQGARGAYTCSEATVRSAYNEAFKYLSINGGQQARKDFERIEQSMTSLAEIVTKQKVEIEDLRQKLGDLTESVGKALGLYLAQEKQGEQEGEKQDA